MDAALLARYEVALRPEALRWTDWVDGQLSKAHDALAQLEKDVVRLDGRMDIGTIAIGCALDYLDFRFGDYDWRATHPGVAAWFKTFNARPSMQATLPPV